MAVVEEQQNEPQNIIQELRELRQFPGSPADFWLLFLDGVGRYAEAQLIFLLAQRPGAPQWRRLGVWPRSANSISNESKLARSALLIADRAEDGHFIIEATEASGAHQRGGQLLGLALALGEGQPPGVVVMLFERLSETQVGEIARRLELIADIPAGYQLSRMGHQAKTDVVQFADTIDLMAQLNEYNRYMAAAMAFCNEIASRHHCDRVGLGWLQGPYVRLQAMSHIEKFDKKMTAVQTLEAAMEEAFDQDEEVVWPQMQESGAVTRDHQHYASQQEVKYLVSLPLRVDNERVGVLTCERSGEAFDEDEVRGLRLIVDQVAYRLHYLKKHDRWFGARWWSGLKEKLAWFLGVEHTFAKALGILVSAILLFVIFGSWNYRVEAPFILRTDDLSYLPAPFDGYVQDVTVKIGDPVKKGELLVSLDTRDLLLDEAGAMADIARYRREAEKSRAENALADMRIAQALRQQSEAQLAKVRYQLDNARILAPFSGMVVEGDLQRMLGAPVHKGDILFKVADIGKMYAELDLPERDIDEVGVGRSGELAFVSNPADKFAIRVDEVDPVAVTKESGNIFLLRADLVSKPAPWLRPGMSGVAKIDVGKRNILWILTHRTVDFFRLLLWW